MEWNNQKKYEKNHVEVEDKKFDKEKNTMVYKRYYHLFKKNELEQICLKAA